MTKTSVLSLEICEARPSHGRLCPLAVPWARYTSHTGCARLLQENKQVNAAPMNRVGGCPNNSVQEVGAKVAFQCAQAPLQSGRLPHCPANAGMCGLGRKGRTLRLFASGHVRQKNEESDESWSLSLK
jgi:hypothetical protein